MIAILQLDPALLEKALAGDRVAFQGIVEETWQVVFIYVQQKLSDREMARDLTQEAFTMAWEKRESLRNPDKFFSWVLTIASNKVIDFMRRRAARPETSASDARLNNEVAAEYRSPLERNEEKSQVQDAMAQLDDLYRSVLILRYWSGLTPGQISRLLAEPEGTIRNRIFRAHLRLRKLLEDGSGDESDLMRLERGNKNDG